MVGGRAVRTSPPGALAEAAPKRAARPREGDRFFILVTPAGDTHAPASFFEELARLAADVYFGSSGGVTGGLREALTAINEQLDGDEGGRTVHALALALRGSEVYAARSGAAFGVLVQGEDAQFFPTDRRDTLVGQLPSLGTGAAPEIQLARYTVAPGQAILLAGAGLDGAADDALQAALGAASISETVDQLKALADQQAAAMVVRFAAPDTPDPDGLAPQPSSRDPRTVPMRPPSRRSGRGSRSPIPRAQSPGIALSEPDSESDAALAASPAPEAATAASEESPVRAATETPATPAVSTPIAAAPSASTTADTDSEDADGSRWIQMRQRLREATAPTTPPVQRGPSAFKRLQLRVQRAARDVKRAVLAAMLGFVNVIDRIFRQILPEPDEEGRSGIPTNIAVGMAILIPVVIVVVVMGLALSRAGESEFEQYLERAQTAHQETLSRARESASTCGDETLRLSWVEVMRLAEQAGRYRPDDETVRRIKEDAQNYLDCYDATERRDLVLLREFEDDAELIGPIVHGGVDVYTLDRANGAIYHDTLDGTRLTTLSSSPIVRRGETISGLAVGDLFDIEWLSSGGTPHDNVLIALDSNGVLVSYSPTFFARAQQLATVGRWQDPVAIAIFRSNLYVLDRGANQVWRYVPPAGARAYSNAPEEYFNGDELPDLSHAVDFGISEEGSVFVLFENGSIKKYRRNYEDIVEEQPFEFRERPAGALTSGYALFVDNDAASRQLYIIDRDNETIYETLWGGTFQHGYRPSGAPDAFEALSGIYAGSVTENNMYVASGNRLYHFFRSP